MNGKSMLPRWLLAFWLALASGPLLAADVLMIRTPQPFDPALEATKSAIQARGYIVSQVQNVDLGLHLMGYLSEEYRAVFFGKPEEIKALAEKHPELAPYLPPQILVFSERNDSLLVAISPAYLARLFPQTDLIDVFARWERDFQEILVSVRDTQRKAPAAQQP